MKIIKGLAVFTVFLLFSCLQNVKKGSSFNGKSAYILGKWNRLDLKTKADTRWNKRPGCSGVLGKRYFNMTNGNKDDYFFIKVPRGSMDEGYGDKIHQFDIACVGGNYYLINSSVLKLKYSFLPGKILLLPIISWGSDGHEIKSMEVVSDKKEYQKLVSDFYKQYPDFKDREISSLSGKDIL